MAQHVAQVKELLNVWQNTFQKSRHRWKDNIKVEFWERLCENVNWIQLCDDTVQWPVAVRRQVSGFYEASTIVKVKVYCSCERQNPVWSEGVVQLIRILIIRWRYVVSYTPWPLYLQEKAAVPTE